MRSGMMTGAEAELLQVLKQLDITPDKQGPADANQQISQAMNESKIQSQIQESVQKQLNSTMAQLKQNSDALQPDQNVQNNLMPTDLSLQKNSLNLQSLIQDTIQQTIAQTSQTTTTQQQQPEQTAAPAPVINTQASSGEIQQIVQKAIQEKDQKQQVAQQISNDANAKLVEDLKTISAVINQQDKSQDAQPALSTSQLEQGGAKKEDSSKEAPLVNIQPVVDQEALIKNITKSVLGQEGTQPGEDNKAQDKQRDALLQNATQAIQGLIQVNAEKIANEAKDKQDIENLQQQINAVAAETAKQAVQAAQAQGQSQTTPGSATQSIQPIDTNQLAQNLITAQAVAQANQAQQQINAQILTQAAQIAQQSQSNQQTGIVNSLTQPTLNLQNEIQRQVSNTLKMAGIDTTKKSPLNQAWESRKQRVMDFLSTTGKIAAITLAITPLPTYLGTWNKPRAEQIQRIESVSFHYLLVNILSCAIWTSYAFKTQNIDLAIINVFPLVIAIILVSIYLSIKPDATLIKHFFAIIAICQIFNFDLLPSNSCGLLGTCTSVCCNIIPLTFMPEVIKTRDVNGINMPLTSVNIVNLAIWETYALLKPDPFMALSQGLGLIFNSTVLMFYFWATGSINAQDTPSLYIIMKQLIKFFKLFSVQQNLKDIQDFFWANENTEFAQAYIKTYKDNIHELESKYEDTQYEKTYEQHMEDMKRINNRLRTVSNNYTKKNNQDEVSNNEDSSTVAGSSDKNKQSNPNNQQYTTFDQNVQIKNRYFDNEANFWNDVENDNIIDLGEQNMNFQPNFAIDDTISMNSFNSSLNFAKLQCQINNKHNQSQMMSESGNKFRSSVNKEVTKYNDEVGKQPRESPKKVHQHKQSIIPNPVQEVSMEDEQSERCNISLHVQDDGKNQDPRSSVQSLINMMTQEQEMKKLPEESKKNSPHHSSNNDSISYLGDDDDESRKESNSKFEDLRNKAQKLKEQKRQKKEQTKSSKNMNSSIEMDGNSVPLQTITKNEHDNTQLIKKESAEDLNAFFDQEKNMSHLPTLNNQKLSDDDEQQLLGSAGNNSNPNVDQGNASSQNTSNNSQNENSIAQNTTQSSQRTNMVFGSNLTDTSQEAKQNENGEISLENINDNNL